MCKQVVWLNDILKRPRVIWCVYFIWCVLFHLMCILYCGFNLFANVWVCICGFCNVWMCKSKGFVISGCVKLWVLKCVGVLVLAMCVLVFILFVLFVLCFCIVSFMYIYSYLFCLY